MASPIRTEKLHALLYVALGAGVLWIGTKAPGPSRMVLVLLGTWLVAHFIRRFALISQAEDRLIKAYRESLRDDLKRATLPRQLFCLLYAVAEVDGSAGQAERELVRRFLATRFPDPVTQSDLASFEQSRVPPEQVLALAYDLRGVLSTQERNTVFFWSCLVAFADGRFESAEHAVLQAISKGLGIDPLDARRLFHHAKARSVHGDSEGGADEEAARQGRTSRARGVVGDRKEALEILGLPKNASQDQIRSRHRELVKEHHPDAHAHLGAVAAQEATERFREIQSAYELLTR